MAGGWESAKTEREKKEKRKRVQCIQCDAFCRRTDTVRGSKLQINHSLKRSIRHGIYF
jgi:hypothetical protein